jgi:hypothetical protein
MLLVFSKNKMPLPSICTRNYSPKSNSQLDDELLNKPLKYTTSPANKWKAEHSRIGSKAEFGPWYEPHIVSASVILFMLYFFVLREENDIDMMLDKPLTDILKNE